MPRHPACRTLLACTLSLGFIPLGAAAAPLGVRAPAPQRRDAQSATVVRLPQSDARLLRLEGYLADKVNAERKRLGLQSLTYDSLLAEVARAHSGEMRDKKYFAHESPTPALHAPIDRYVLVFGDTPHLIAENIYRDWSDGPQRLTNERIDKAHDSLMNSPGHRANILEPSATRLGIGIVANSNGDLWVTEEFTRP